MFSKKAVTISTVCIKFVLLAFQTSQVKGYFLDQFGIRIGHNAEQHGGKCVCVQKQKACSRTPVVKTEPHRNQNKLLSSGITILLLDTSVHVRCYIFHLQNDIKPPKVADKMVTPELEVTLTWHGSTIIKGVLPCWGVRVPSLSVLQGRSFLLCLQKLEILLAILHNPLHAAAACESPHGSLCGVLLWCTADISEIHHVRIACIFMDLLAGWRTRSLWPCKLGIRDGVFFPQIYFTSYNIVIRVHFSKYSRQLLWVSKITRSSL